MRGEDKRKRLVEAGYKAVDELIRIAEEKILRINVIDQEGEIDQEGQAIAADRLKNAAATKKLAIFDAFDILEKIESVEEDMRNEAKGDNKTSSKDGFAERNSQ